ncbi:hypothetical protein [Aestuariispira insulae]|uniref:Phytanoyl-CoA dioxygenase PhyH n=1 Tax=Aestuariispira insulae TaxID=1461337 RepID=A0A3D9HKI0_9PROT|nr:hypothetical protein [Aestuariispira insulae]RED49925.1 hypothetical protein DFP90_105298 [Aestuariispira insulae]
MLTQHFEDLGWCRFPFDFRLKDWVDAALKPARATVTDPANEEWFRYGRTWFVGVHVLPNDPAGRVEGGPELAGGAMDFIRTLPGNEAFSLDRAQVSVCYPGYPQPMAGESDGVYRFRMNRDAAHLDGLLHVGADRRRYLKQFHRFVLGIPLVETRGRASPFVIWEGSHRIIGDALKKAFSGLSESEWDQVDLTEIYQAARREVFETCRRVELAAAPGEAYLAHRHSIHGMAPWGKDAQAGPDGRMIAYFRPETEDRQTWLEAP